MLKDWVFKTYVKGWQKTKISFWLKKVKCENTFFIIELESLVKILMSETIVIKEQNVNLTNWLIVCNM